MKRAQDMCNLIILVHIAHAFEQSAPGDMFTSQFLTDLNFRTALSLNNRIETAELPHSKKEKELLNQIITKLIKKKRFLREYFVVLIVI